MAYISKIQLPGSETPYIIKDSGLTTRVGAIETTIASALVFKGVVGNAAGIEGLTDYKTGWSYKANASFEMVGLGKVESGDMIICVSDYNDAYAFTDWTIIQNNVDIMTGATALAAGTKGLVPAPQATQQGLFLRGDGTWAEAAVQWGKISDLL